MTRRQLTLILVVGLVLAAVVVVWTWSTWPGRQLAVARKALAAGDLVRAEALLAPLLESQPDDATVFLLSAQLLRHQKRYGEAEVALQRAADRGLDTHNGRRELALLLAEQDWPREAEGILQQVLRDYPDDPEVLQTLARGYANHQRWADAERLCSHLVELRPNEIDPLFQRGWVRMKNTKFSAAIEDFRKVLVRNVNHFPARLYLAHSLLSEARMAEAEVELLACHKLRPDRPEPLVGLANCAVEKNDLKTAEERLNQALALDRSSPLVLHEVVNLHLLQGRYNLAQEVLEILVKQVPNDKQVQLQLAQVYHRKGDLERAARHQRRYEELDRLEETRLRGMR